MEFLSKILFAAAALALGIGVIDGSGSVTWNTYESVWVNWSIALFLAAIGAELIWGRRTRSE